MEVTPVQIEHNHHVRGEEPTRAGPTPVRKPPAALRRATGRGARTRVAPRGVATKWSAGGEFLRSRMVAFQCGAPVRHTRVAWGEGSHPDAPLAGCRRIGLPTPGRVYRGRGTRQRSTMTEGSLTPSNPGQPGAETARYKRCEIRVGGGGTGGLSCAFGELSSPQLRTDQEPRGSRSTRGEGGREPRGVTAAEGGVGASRRSLEELRRGMDRLGSGSLTPRVTPRSVRPCLLDARQTRSDRGPGTKHHRSQVRRRGVERSRRLNLAQLPGKANGT